MKLNTLNLYSIWTAWGQPSLTQEWLELFSAAMRHFENGNPTLTEVREAVMTPKTQKNSQEVIAFLETLKDRWQSGEPIQYVVGAAPFFSELYFVDQSVLIPRPETEILVQECANWLEGKENPTGFELGVGSGCISIELLLRFPFLKMVGSEIALNALKTAKRNAEKILSAPKNKDFTLVEGDSQEPFSYLERKSYQPDFIISNPPYLLNPTEAEKKVNQYEPKGALYAPAADPLFFYKKSLEALKNFLNPSGALFLEIPHERAAEIENMARSMGFEHRIFLDLTSRPRVLIAWKKT